MSMGFSAMKDIECPECHERYSSSSVNKLCRCGSPLLVAYDTDNLSKAFSKDVIAGREKSLWRYHELLPVTGETGIVTLGEGMTPLLRTERLGEKLGIPRLFVKDESIIPTGTFKARGAAVGISRAKELGIRQIVMPTNGNAGAAWSVYAAKAGIEAHIVMPESAPRVTMSECAATGAHLYLVDGLISDAGVIARKAAEKYGLFDVSTLKEPYRIEGKKTMGLEIMEQLSWNVPDVILYPTGGGVGLIGINKAVSELIEIGWLDRRPRLVAVQSSGCAPVVRAWENKRRECEFWKDSKTVAFGINVPKPLGDRLILDGLYQTDGCAVEVTDEELLAAQKTAGSLEGIFMCPEGAATIAAVKKLGENGWIQRDETVIALNTGAGIKYPDTVQVDAPHLSTGDNIEI